MSHLFQSDDKWSTYEYVDPISKIKCIGLFGPPDVAGFCEVQDFERVLAPADVPNALDDVDFEPESVLLKDVPLVKMMADQPIKRIHKSAVIEAIYVVSENSFESHMLTLYRPGMEWVFRIKYVVSDVIVSLYSNDLLPQT